MNKKNIFITLTISIVIIICIICLTIVFKSFNTTLICIDKEYIELSNVSIINQVTFKGRGDIIKKVEGYYKRVDHNKTSEAFKTIFSRVIDYPSTYWVNYEGYLLEWKEREDINDSDYKQFVLDENDIPSFKIAKKYYTGIGYKCE